MKHPRKPLVRVPGRTLSKIGTFAFLFIFLSHASFAQEGGVTQGLNLMKDEFIVIANIIFIAVAFGVLIAAIWHAGFQLIKWKGYVVGLILVFVLWGGFHVLKDQIFSYFGGSQVLTETGAGG